MLQKSLLRPRYLSEARVKRRSSHAPNLIQLNATLVRPWSGVKLNVELNMSLLLYIDALHKVLIKLYTRTGGKNRNVA